MKSDANMNDLINKTKEDIIKIGRALLVLGFQNTHSGNISTQDGNDIYITKTGSMLGHLEKRDIVLPGLHEPKAGLFQSSSETGIHREILKFSKAVIHAHTFPATILSYFLDEIIPIDFLGQRYIGSVPISEFEYPVGSKEMEDGIPDALKKHPAMIVKTHGPFVRGSNLNEAFFLLSILDYSSEILLNLTNLGFNPTHIKQLTYPQIPAHKDPVGKYATRDKELIRQFKRTSSDLFKLRLSPFHTGSISVSDGNEMLFSHAASTPDYIGTDIERIDIKDENTDFFKKLHQAVYRYSNAKSVIFAHSPLAMVLAVRAIVKGEDRIIPVDAEGGYLYPAIPVLMPDEGFVDVVKKVSRYKIAALAGLGVLAIGHTPGDTLHHCSSLKNISYIKIRLETMEKLGVIDNVAEFLIEKGKNW